MTQSESVGSFVFIPIHHMGAILFISMGILFLLSIPIITSRMAKRLGRDPRAWFFMGLLLPVISSFILFLLPDKSEAQGHQNDLPPSTS